MDRRRGAHPSAAASELRERMARIELHLERVTAAAGAPLAAHASATIMAGGKRLRPLLVVLAAEAAGGPGLDPAALVRRGGGTPAPRGGRGRARALGDARARRRDRRAPRCGAGRPTVVAAARDGQVAIATGDLLFSRAFAELARNDDPGPAARALGRQLGARRGRAAPARGRLRLARRDRALSAALRAEDRRAVRSRLPSRRARAAGAASGPARRSSRTRSAPSPGGSGWPSRFWTTCSTSPARSSAPARRAARICSTGPSRCR